MDDFKTLDEYMAEVHATAAEVYDVLDGIDPAIQTAALTKILGDLVFSAVKAGVFASLDEALHHYSDGMRAMYEDLDAHFNGTQQ